MNMDAFIDKLFQAAKEAGFSVAEAYLAEDDSFNATAMNQEITQYASHQTRGLGFRAMLNSRMGYASTEAFDDAAVEWLISGARDSATLCEDTDEAFLYDGHEPIAKLQLTGMDAPAAEKIAFVLELERQAKAYDARVAQVGYDTVVTGHAKVRIVNTLGLDKQYETGVCGAYLQPVAREGEDTSTGFDISFARDFSALSAEKLGRAAAAKAVNALHATPVPSGNYRVVLHQSAMVDLLEAFAPAFSAENAQKDLSLLKGKLGEIVAAPCVTIVDDPLRADGLNSYPFDAEGVPGARHPVVENGVFRTFLHNLKTAHKDGVASTGNGSKASYQGAVRVSPSNFSIEPGTQTLIQLLSDVGDGLVITELEGLHAGADAVSGDFSLLSKGYTLKNGVRERPVEQVTVAGNFFTLLKQIRAVANDLRFPSGGFGSPSVDAGLLSVAGKGAEAEG